jgi:glutathione S-transferase
MRLFHSPLSSNARRVLITLHHLGLAVEMINVDLLDQGDRRRLAELNPNGKVPVLQDGDFVLWESCAIMQYLADLTPHQTLYPQDPRARADVNRWSSGPASICRRRSGL